MQTPYIGSKISLISNSEIRYEGILYTVDTHESTIALAKVRSFGTETRPTETPVLGRDDIYEYIIFKASDIKDLMVCETPKPVPQLSGGLPYDPAIISVSSHRVPPTNQRTSTSPAAKPISGSSSRSDTPQHRSLISPTMDSAIQTNRAPGIGRQQHQQQQHQQQQQKDGARRGGFQPQQMTRPMRGPPPPSYRNILMSAPGRGAGSNIGPIGPPTHFGRGAFLGSRGNMGNRGGMSRGMRRGSGDKDKLKFDSDYDFETANEKFQETLDLLKDELKTKAKIDDGEMRMNEKKDDSETETGVQVVKESTDKDEKDKDEGFYDKTSSFFDRISCEALERQQGRNGRPNWRKERETNQETFGHSAVRSLAFRRGGGRGGGFGGGRGYYFGGRGAGPYNNSNYNYNGSCYNQRYYQRY